MLLLLVGCYTDFEPSKQETTPGKVTAQPTPEPRRATKKPKKKPRQTYRQAWEVICHAEARAGVDPALGRQERGAKVASWLVEHLKHKAVRYWFIRFGDTKEEPDRRAMFRAEAGKAGQVDCPLERLLFESPASQSAPTN